MFKNEIFINDIETRAPEAAPIKLVVFSILKC